MQSEQAYAISH